MRALLVLSLLSLTACVSPSVEPTTSRQQLNVQQLAQTLNTPSQALAYVSSSQPYLSQHSLPGPMVSGDTPPYRQLPSEPLLSLGDRVRIWLPQSPVFNGVLNSNDAEFNQIFEINIDGNILLPYIGPLAAQGLPPLQLKTVLNKALEQFSIFEPGMAMLDLAIVEWAPATVFVSGAVFNPGQVVINVRRPENRQLLQDNVSGDYPSERLLQSALRAAGGVTPDADISRIEVIRNGVVYHADLRGVLLGVSVAASPLMHGDIVRVNSTGMSQRELFKPSAITPPGIRIFISNLVRPAFDNASGAIGQHATSLPYGARLHTAAISGNCAGGTVSTNSNRLIVLVSTDPLTRQPVAIERNIEALLRAPDRLDLNPFLMPDDSVVCYDSRVTNLRDIGNALSDILFPFTWLIRGTTLW